MDRQDIDALLIGALYGELTPAEEARLAAHLESHPADRGALDDLRRARAAVRESRILEHEVEPPQAVSALLLQEAARRAPKRALTQGEPKESWFFRFTRAFMAHPAMAAAAMLVVVVGVAGTLYVKKGDTGFVDQQAPAPAVHAEAAPQTGAKEESAFEPSPEATPAPEGAAADTATGYSVGLDDTAVGKSAPVADSERRERQMAKQKEDAGNRSRGIVVSTPERAPKELDAPRPKRAAKPAASRALAEAELADDSRFDAKGNFASSTSTTAPRASGAGVPAPPPPSAGAAPPPSAPVAKPAPVKQAEKVAAQDDALLAWARSEHNRTVALASKGDCAAAAKIAVAVQSRAPDYYAQFMATDRLLKKCQAYIAQQRDAEAEMKARAQKRAISSDEPGSARE